MWGCKTPKGVTYTASGFYLDTFVEVTLYGCGSQKIANKAVDMCKYYQNIFNFRDESSTLAKLNQSGSMRVATEEDEALAGLVSIGLDYGKRTDYSLNIALGPATVQWDFINKTVPDKSEIESALKNVTPDKILVSNSRVELNGNKIDLGAVAKGYIADKIKEYLVEEGVDSAIINLGGNILCVGQKTDNKKFKIAVQQPFGRGNEVAFSLGIDDMSVVTSGVYERYFYRDDILYHHILDPDTGYPCDNGLWSVTIISSKSVDGDCLCTGCFVMGLDRAVKLIDSMEDVYAIFIDDNSNIIYSAGAEAFVN